MSDYTAAVFDSLCQRAGVILFTVTVVDRKAGLARRCYSSHPEAYPVTGTKPIGSDAWSIQVLEKALPFVANDTAGFAVYFSDHALINSLGCEAALNIPVLKDGVVAGTVNLLDKAGHFTPARVAELQGLVQSETPLLLAAFAATGV
ncbi:GAF domain-containing protein [Tabrizicola sp. J26]|uniref:GAF domain-containing protein n=1 Tax=Alitabrizicola rongguiensis TaxID=2909234 RepID=UPI001F40B902|nr:GAF domain-containing protein [Tabrizicola rongguiensis]MCF1709383.1 GAF domain-containing protein [Tabrizicola rongguiensis]